MARHWVADFWVVHHLGRAPMTLVRAQLGCAQMGNAVKDQYHSKRRSVEPRIMWVVAAWVGVHLGCAPQRVALVYRRAKSFSQQGTNPKSLANINKSEANFCKSALLLSLCENRLCLSQIIKKLNSTERGALFWHFCVSKVITTAHAHKSGVTFHIFPRAFKQKKWTLYDQRWLK